MEFYSKQQFENSEHPQSELLAAFRAKILVGDMDEYILYHVLSCDECLEIEREISLNVDLSEIEEEMEKESLRISVEFKEAVKKFIKERERWEDLIPFLFHLT